MMDVPTEAKAAEVAGVAGVEVEEMEEMAVRDRSFRKIQIHQIDKAHL